MKLKDHKLLAIFNLLPLLLIIIGYSIGIGAQSNIGMGMVAWGFLSVFIILVADAVIFFKTSARLSKSPKADEYSRKLSKANSISIVAGTLFGLALAISVTGSAEGDAGMFLIPLAAMYAAVGVFSLYILTHLALGRRAERIRVLIWLVVAVSLVAAYFLFSDY